MAAAGWRMRCTFAKETSIIGKFVQIFNYLRRQGFCKKAKETSVIGEFVQSFQAPLCKGSSAAGGEGLFFYTPTAARFPNPSRRRLQACFAHSQIPSTTSWSPSPYTWEANSEPVSALPSSALTNRKTLSRAFARERVFFILYLSSSYP